MSEAEDRTEIGRLEAERARAIVAADHATLEALTDEAYVHVEASGRLRDKAGFLAGVAPDGGRFERYELIDNDIRLFGDMALVSGQFENVFVAGDGERRIRRARHIRVYVRRPEGWRNVSHQATAIA